MVRGGNSTQHDRLRARCAAKGEAQDGCETQGGESVFHLDPVLYSCSVVRKNKIKMLGLLSAAVGGSTSGVAKRCWPVFYFADDPMAQFSRGEDCERNKDVCKATSVSVTTDPRR